MRHTNEAVEAATDAAIWSLTQITNYILPNPSEGFKMHGGISGKFMSVEISIQRDEEGLIQNRALILRQVQIDRKPPKHAKPALLNAAVGILAPFEQSFSFEEQATEKGGQSGVRRRVEVKRGNVSVYRRVTFAPKDMDETIESYHDVMPPWDRNKSLTQMAIGLTEMTKVAAKRRSNTSDDPTFP